MLLASPLPPTLSEALSCQGQAPDAFTQADAFAESKADSHFSQFRPSGDSTKATASAKVENFSPAQLNDPAFVL
jgi:hypothetical protein